MNFYRGGRLDKKLYDEYMAEQKRLKQERMRIRAEQRKKEKELEEKKKQQEELEFNRTICRGYDRLYGAPLPEPLESEWSQYRVHESSDMKEREKTAEKEQEEITPILTERPSLEEYGEDMLNTLESAYILDSCRVTYVRKKATAFPSQLLGLLTNITEINLSNNEIVDLPPALSQLTNLRKMYLSHNQINRFPEELCCGLSLLRVLDMNHNKLVSMPPQTSEMAELQILDLSHNTLRNIPPEVGFFQKLETLILAHNRLNYIPPDIGFLPKISTLLLNNNPIRSLPSDIYQMGTKKVLEFLRGAMPEAETGAELRRYAFSSDFSDIRIILNKGNPLKCHKVVLSARSSKFAEILAELRKEEPGQITELKVNWDNPASFKNLIRYIYNDAVDTKTFPNHYKELESLALFYRVPRLAFICAQVDQPYIIVPESTFATDFVSTLNEPVRYSDVAFRVEGQEIEAHKIILSSSCRYFKGMFHSGLKETQERVIPLNNVKADVFRAIREFCYTGDIAEISGDIAIDLLHASSEYTLPGLKSMMESLLGYSLDTENAPCLYEVAVLYGAEVLGRACLFFILHNLKKVECTDAWKDMTSERREAIITKAKKYGFQKEG